MIGREAAGDEPEVVHEEEVVVVVGEQGKEMDEYRHCRARPRRAGKEYETGCYTLDSFADVEG
jgi:hypothetical protein